MQPLSSAGRAGTRLELKLWMAGDSADRFDYWRASARSTATSWRGMFQPGTVGPNVSAGITVALIALPLNLALAIACGLPPSVGLVSGAIAGVLGALFGASRFQITGPEVALAPMTLAIVVEHGFEGLLVITFLAGLMQLAFGALRLGRLVDAIPVPVIGGFLAAVGLLVYDAQLPRLLGLPPEVQRISALESPSVLLGAQPASVLLGLGVAAIVALLPRYRKKLPAPLFALALAALAAPLFGGDFATVAPIDARLPTPHLPVFGRFDLVALLPTALALALLSSIDSLLCAVSVDSRIGGERTRSDQELVAQGLANLTSACVGGMPVAAAVVRSVAAIEAGATTRLAPLVQSAALGLVLLVLGPVVTHIPLVALAAILLVVGSRLVNLRQLASMWKMARAEAWIFVLTAAGILIADFVVGVAIGVIAALAHFARQQRESLLPGVGVGGAPTPLRDGGSRVLHLEGPLFFASQDRIEALLRDVGSAGPVVIDLSRVTTVDVSGAVTLAKALQSVAAAGRRVVLAGVEELDPLLRWALAEEGPAALAAAEAPSTGPRRAEPPSRESQPHPMGSLPSAATS